MILLLNQNHIQQKNTNCREQLQSVNKMWCNENTQPSKVPTKVSPSLLKGMMMMKKKMLKELMKKKLRVKMMMMLLKKLMEKMLKKLMKKKDDEEVEYDADDPRKIHNNSNKMTEMFIKRVEVLLHDE